MPYTKPITETIQKRFSCRTYAKTPIEEETRALLADFASSLRAGPFGTEPRFTLLSATEEDRMALRGLGTYGFIRSASGFVIGAMGSGERGLEDYGHLMERIVLYATELGLGTCWLGGSFTKSRFAARIQAGDEETVPAVTAVGYVAQQPGALDSMVRAGAGAHRRLPWENLFYAGRFGVPIAREQAGDYAPALEMVRLGPSASNKQPWRIVQEDNAWHFYLQRTPGYRQGLLMRLMRIADMQRLDIGIAMCHFELTAGELGLPGAWSFEKPDLAEPDELTEYTASWLAG